jgi:hypothetical protein
MNNKTKPHETHENLSIKAVQQVARHIRRHRKNINIYVLLDRAAFDTATDAIQQWSFSKKQKENNQLARASNDRHRRSPKGKVFLLRFVSHSLMVEEHSISGVHADI